MKKTIETRHPNGALRVRSELDAQGCPNGTVEEYFPSGALRLRRPYVRGFLHGKSAQFNPDGVLLGEFEMVYGTGVFHEWHDNGQLQSRAQWQAGELNGPSEFHDNEGKLMLRTYYLKGEKVSKKAFEEAEDAES